MKDVAVLLSFMVVCCSLFGQEAHSRRWEDAIQKFEMKDKVDPPREGSILFLGSSSIAMWQDVSNYFPNHHVINRGFGGSEFSDLIYYADRVIYKYKPSKIFIYEGDNDLAAGEASKLILREAIALREEIEKELPGTPVIFISPKPSIARWKLKQKYEEFNKGLERYASRTKLTEFADVWSAMLDAEGQVIDSVFLEDGLHMKLSGYEIWKSVLLPYLENK